MLSHPLASFLMLGDQSNFSLIPRGTDHHESLHSSKKLCLVSRPCILWGLSDPPADKCEDMAVRAFEVKTPTPICQPAGHHLLSEQFEHQWVEALSMQNLDSLLVPNGREICLGSTSSQVLSSNQGVPMTLWDGEVQAHNTWIPLRYSSADGAAIQRLGPGGMQPSFC